MIIWEHVEAFEKLVLSFDTNGLSGIIHTLPDQMPQGIGFLETPPPRTTTH